MLEISNVKIYDLKESIISCRNAMRLEPPQYTEEEFQKGLERAKKLVHASYTDKNVHCHDNFMTGIRVSFDLKYQLQRKFAFLIPIVYLDLFHKVQSFLLLTVHYQ